MGEARDRMKAGLGPRILKPGEQFQVQVDIKNATSKICECGCRYFIPVFEIYTVSALVSPIGKEMNAQKPALVCMKCNMPLGNKEAENPVEVGEKK